MIGGLLAIAAGAARGSVLGKEDRRRRRIEDEQLARQNRISDAQIADYESRARQRDALAGANRSAYESHGRKHPGELTEYNPGIDYGRLELDEADEARRTTAARTEQERTRQEKLDALIAAGVSPEVARARVVAGYDPEAVANARASRELMNEQRRLTIADRARNAVLQSAQGTADKLAAEGGTIPGVQSALEQLYRGKLDAGTIAGIAARAVRAGSRRNAEPGRGTVLTVPGAGRVEITPRDSVDAISDEEIDDMLQRGMTPDAIAAEVERRMRGGRP